MKLGTNVASVYYYPVLREHGKRGMGAVPPPPPPPPLGETGFFLKKTHNRQGERTGRMFSTGDPQSARDGYTGSLPALWAWNQY